jgi:DNA transposition AAA+ family ATPase
MDDYAAIAKIFEERTQDLDFFKNAEVLYIKKNIEYILKTDVKQLIFLVGEPGVGKSAFLSYFSTFFPQYSIIKFDMPFFEPVDFVTTLIKKSGEEVENFSLDALIKQVVEIYNTKNYIILIDEAQLLSKQMIEIIRILSDSKAFWFLLAMHKHESKEILQEPQFASRPHKVLELQVLQKSEYKDFIYTELKHIDRPIVREALSHKYLNFIFKLTHGNLRNLKKLLFHTFLLLQYAHENDKKKYQTISKCLLTMAAIDGDLLDV